MRRRAALLAAAVIGLHVVGFALLLEVGALGIGVGLTAYTLGLRHAFDADHITAIDNTTRRLMARGERPLSVGFFFALGHSTVVLAAAVLLAFGVRDFAPPPEMGAAISGVFLCLIGLINLRLLLDGEGGGAMTRVFGRLFRTVERPSQMYAVGFLFGLGFDTATEVGLLLLAATAALGGVPPYAILCLPVLFAAGMALLDTLDGALMSFAYGAGKRSYNVLVTGVSVATALGIGAVELLSAAGIAEVDLRVAGYAVAGVFALAWAAAAAARRLARS